MSEVLKIDNESLDLKKQIEKDLVSAEEKAKVNEALGMLKIFDSKIPDFDIDMTYDKKNDKFFFISWNELLNIAMDIWKIQEVWDAIVKLLNNKNKLWITWKQDFRRIYEDNFFWNARDNQVYYKWTPLDWNNLDLDLAINNNNFVEELYKFTQKVKWIPEKNWIIQGGIWDSKNIWIYKKA